MTTSYDAALFNAADRYMARRYGGPSGTHTCHVERDLDDVQGTTVCYTVEVEVDEGVVAEEGRIVGTSGPERHSPLCLAKGTKLRLTEEEREHEAGEFSMAVDEDRS